MTRLTSQARAAALRGIESAAGNARGRYLTNTFGQLDTYRAKLQQATDYLAARALNASAAVPPYIQAEAAALAQTLVGTCNRIITAASTYENTTGPAIEAARLVGRQNVRQAAQGTGTEDAVLVAIEAARLAAVDSLDAV